MITTDRITGWLREPHQLHEVDPKALAQLVKEYPYFIPAHYCRFIGAGQEDSSALFNLRQNYPVNPVLLSLLMKASTETPREEARPEAQSMVEEEVILQPASAEDYFLQQGIHVPGDLPEREDLNNPVAAHSTPESVEDEKEKSLMVVMSFAEWLKHISSKNQKAKEEEAEQKALKAMWQKQKLAAAIEEESEEIPEQVFEMAVNSISRKEELVSESLAEVYVKQGKKEKAIELYRKLSLLNPEKNAYFAARIESLQKDL